MINLKKLADENNWQLDVDPASTKKPRSPKVDPALLTIRCRYGHLYPDGLRVGVAVDSPRIAAKMVRAGFTPSQHGDDGSNFVIDIADLPEAARFVRPVGARGGHRK